MKNCNDRYCPRYEANRAGERVRIREEGSTASSLRVGELEIERDKLLEELRDAKAEVVALQDEIRALEAHPTREQWVAIGRDRAWAYPPVGEEFDRKTTNEVDRLNKGSLEDLARHHETARGVVISELEARISVLEDQVSEVRKNQGRAWLYKTWDELK